MGEIYKLKDTKIFTTTKVEPAKVETPKVEPTKAEEPKIIEQVNSNLDEVITTADLLNLNPQNVLNGIIWSEILGKPRCLRKGR